MGPPGFVVWIVSGVLYLIGGISGHVGAGRHIGPWIDTHKAARIVRQETHNRYHEVRIFNPGDNLTGVVIKRWHGKKPRLALIHQRPALMVIGRFYSPKGIELSRRWMAEHPEGYPANWVDWPIKPGNFTPSQVMDREDARRFVDKATKGRYTVVRAFALGEDLTGLVTQSKATGTRRVGVITGAPRALVIGAMIDPHGHRVHADGLVQHHKIHVDTWAADFTRGALQSTGKQD